MASFDKGDNDRSSSSIMDLPEHILADILIQLSDITIVVCKFVCKAWRQIISDPQFTKNYFARPRNANVFILVRPLGLPWVSRTLYFVDPKNYIRDNSTKLTLDTKFEIPLNNLQMLFDSNSYAELNYNQQCGLKRKQYLQLDDTSKHRFKVTNSCNGLLCLTSENMGLVCNPLTGEFIELFSPSLEYENIRYWLGFSPRSNNYEVIRMFGHEIGKWRGNRDNSFCSLAQIQILVTRSWKNIGHAPMSQILSYPTFSNGKIYWLYESLEEPEPIVSFGFDDIKFGTFKLPPGIGFCLGTRIKGRSNLTIEVLGNQLCCCAVNIEYLDIWVMNTYGDVWSWTKICNVGCCFKGRNMGTFGYFQPINRLENGDIVLFYCRDYRNFGMVYYESETRRVKSFRFKGITARFGAVSFTPSFAMLKNVLAGDEVEVLNVNSRCAELKIKRDNSPLFLVPEDKS